MSDEERNKLLDMLKKATKEARAYSPEQARQKLIDEGFYVEDGEVSSMCDISSK